MKKKLLCLLILFALVETSYSVSAKSINASSKLMNEVDDDGDLPPVDDPPPLVPINDWVTVLFIGGIALVGYSLRQSRKNNSF